MTTQPHSQLSAGVPPREERPAPDVLRALMAAAGALISLGAIIAAAELHSRSRFAAVVLALVLGLFGYLVLAGPDPLMAPTGVVLVAVACGALPPLLLVDDRTTSLTGVFALMALLWAGAWLAPLTRGRPFLLGLALCGGWMLLLSVAEDDLGAGAGVGASDTSTAAYLSLIVGAGLLVAAWAFDRQGRAAFATPFVAVGDLAAVVGALAVANDVGDTGGSLVVAAVGVALGLVGHAGRRRGTTWIGAALVAGGVVGLVVAILSDDASAYAGGFGILAGGLLLAAVTIAVGRRATATGATPTAGATPSFEATGAGALVDRTPPTAPGGTGSAAEWRPDPSGRHALRWWDGTRWTEHVSDGGGRTSTDPYDA